MRVGIKGLTPHELRHTAALLAVSAGANVKAVQRMLGHASAAVTLDVYAELFDDDLDSIATAFDCAAMQSDVAKAVYGLETAHRQERESPRPRPGACVCW